MSMRNINKLLKFVKTKKVDVKTVGGFSKFTKSKEAKKILSEDG